jgi:hypothetical protein
MKNVVVTAWHMKDAIKSKTVAVGSKGGKGSSKSDKKSKGTNKKKGKSKNLKVMQSEPMAPVDVDICDFDSACISGKYRLCLGVPAATLVCFPDMLLTDMQLLKPFPLIAKCDYLPCLRPE